MLGRYLATDGLVGEIPDWYLIGRAAQYWGVPPWVMMKQSIFWREKAIVAMEAEESARKQKEKHNGG